MHIYDGMSDKLPKRSKLEIRQASCVGFSEFSGLTIRKNVFITIFNSFIFTFLKRNMQCFGDRSVVGPMVAEFSPKMHDLLSRFVNLWS